MKNEFVWTDELINEFLGFYVRQQKDCDIDNWGKDLIKVFKESKQSNLDFKILKSRNDIFGVHDYFEYGNTPCNKQYHPCEIYSVKRLSDNEVFTIGDNTTKGIIKSFEVHDGWLGVNVGDQNTLLRTFDKAKRPSSFTTEDGKECLDKEMIFGVALLATGTDLIRRQVLPFSPYSLHTNRKWFSTEKLANEYILMNKPLFSIQEIMNTLCTQIKDTVAACNTLKYLAKNKLNDNSHE